MAQAPCEFSFVDGEKGLDAKTFKMDTSFLFCRDWLCTFGTKKVTSKETLVARSFGGGGQGMEALFDDKGPKRLLQLKQEMAAETDDNDKDRAEDRLNGQMYVTPVRQKWANQVTELGGRKQAYDEESSADGNAADGPAEDSHGKGDK
eukprot:s5333_g1.t1